MTDKISPADPEADAKQMMDALPRTLAALRVAGHEQAAEVEGSARRTTSAISRRTPPTTLARLHTCATLLEGQ